MTTPIEPAFRDEPVVVQHAPAPTSAFVPVLILGLVMLGWFVFQALDLRSERATMRDAIASQDKQMQEAKKVRDAFDSLVRGTAELAASGNPSAQAVVEDLRSHGVPIPPLRAPSEADGPTSR